MKKATLPWMKYFVGDWEKMTAAMTVAERGAYQRLVDHYWTHGSLTSNEAAICRITRTSPEEWLSLREAVMSMFEWDEGEGVWRCEYLDSLKEHRGTERDQQSKYGKQGAEARRRMVTLGNGEGLTLKGTRRVNP
jgi:uncharacterized protein YdaU (DUF1376 family)